MLRLLQKKIYDKNRVNRYIIKIYLIFFHITYWIVVNYMEYPRALRVFNAYMFMEYIIKENWTLSEPINICVSVDLNQYNL